MVYLSTIIYPHEWLIFMVNESIPYIYMDPIGKWKRKNTKKHLVVNLRFQWKNLATLSKKFWLRWLKHRSFVGSGSLSMKQPYHPTFAQSKWLWKPYTSLNLEKKQWKKNVLAFPTRRCLSSIQPCDPYFILVIIGMGFGSFGMWWWWWLQFPQRGGDFNEITGDHGENFLRCFGENTWVALQK